MGYCNHSLSSSVYHSRTLNTCYRFYWTSRDHNKTSLALLYHWEWKASWSTAVLKNSILQSPLSLICRTNLWIESVSGMDGAWWTLSGSTISSDFGKYTVIIDGTNFVAASENSLCVDHNLACLYSSENDVFDGSTYAIHWAFAMVSLIVEPAQWLIQEHCSC